MRSFAPGWQWQIGRPNQGAHVLIALTALLLLVAGSACDRGGPELAGWRATDPSTDLALEPESGPNGEDVAALLYSMSTGVVYVIERSGPPPLVNGLPSLSLQARATRTLYLAVVLVDEDGREYECGRNLSPGDWRTLGFDQFDGFAAGTKVVKTRLVDRTAQLGSQGPVSLKLVGLTQ